MTKIRVGTRNSRLARAQTELMGRLLSTHHVGLEVEYVEVVTQGDQTTTPLYESKTPGVFVSALREELLDHGVDVIVHSMKDLPAAHHPRIVLAGVPAREDPRDVVVSRDNLALSDLPAGALVGTSSPRRAASVRRWRADLRVESIRGNVDTRIDKVARGDYDATVMALAGLKRTGLTGAITEHLSLKDFLPAPRQGALALECRLGDLETAELVGALEHPHTRLTTEAERGVLVGLGAGCSTAVGALATWEAGVLTLLAELAVVETGEAYRIVRDVSCAETDGGAALALGLAVAEEFRESDIFEKVSWL